MYTFLILELVAWIATGIIAFYILFHIVPKKHTVRKTLHKFKFLIILLFCTIALGVYSQRTYPPDFAMPMWMHSFDPHQHAPNLPIINIFNFFKNIRNFEKIEDIAADPNAVPKPISYTEPQLVSIDLVTQEVISEVAPGIFFNYWTFNNQVPGPMLRIRQGDTVQLSITNHVSSIHPHNIDLHAVTGPGGGASVTKVMPGETKSFTWKALNPGLYIYHCATTNVSVHNSHGQYGLILVEPVGGLPPVDKEFYLVQGELYTVGGAGRKGLTRFDSQGLQDGIPSYITFNGRVPNENKAMKVNVGDKVRIYVGNGGVNLVSSFHVIGEIFDTVYPEGAIGEGSAILKNVQTTTVLPGGSSIVEFTADVPGTLVVVDHALARMNKGAWATIEVIGEEQPEIFRKGK